MNTLLRRASARHFGILAFAQAVFAAAVSAAGPDAAPLALHEAADLAVASQPLLEAQRQAVRAARETATAAAQLPDPTLVGGVSDVMLSGPERYTLSGEGETQTMLGVKQVFPGGRERKLRGARGSAEADRLTAELDEQRRMIRREAALVWLDAWKTVRAQELTHAAIAEAQRQSQAADIAYRAGRAAQADVLASRVSVELLNDQLAGMAQDEWHARNGLRRWIGAEAERTLDPALPQWPAPDEAALLSGLDAHPHLAAQLAAVNVARAEVDLARADYRPDWSVELGYGYRPDLSDFASVQFEIGLPVFTHKRQDRVVESRTAEMQRAESLREDWLRQHRAHIRLNVDDWRRLQQRFARYDEAILPQAQQRLEAALATYGAGSGTLLSVIDARRSLLDIRMQRLELETDAARHQTQLHYFAPQGEQP